MYEVRSMGSRFAITLIKFLVNHVSQTNFSMYRGTLTENLDLVQVKGLLRSCPLSFRYTDVVLKSVLYLTTHPLF